MINFIKTFQISKTVNGSEVNLWPTLIGVNNRTYLIDCGYEETFPEFENGLAKIGIHLTDLHAIVISHDDIDHLGALTLLKNKHRELIIYCSADESASVSGNVKSERLQQAENSLATLPEEHKAWGLDFINKLMNIKRISPDAVLYDQDLIENDIQILSTPGHTKGHVSLYIPSSKTLIANDAFVIEQGEFEIANPQFTLDLKTAIKSVEKIKALELEKVICYHGGISETDIAGKLERLVKRYKTNSP